MDAPAPLKRPLLAPRMEGPRPGSAQRDAPPLRYLTLPPYPCPVDPSSSSQGGASPRCTQGPLVNPHRVRNEPRVPFLRYLALPPCPCPVDPSASSQRSASPRCTQGPLAEASLLRASTTSSRVTIAIVHNRLF